MFNKASFINFAPLTEDDKVKTFDLSPITVFTGPNRSGKTSILSGLRMACASYLSGSRSLEEFAQGGLINVVLEGERHKAGFIRCFPKNPELDVEETVPESDVLENFGDVSLFGGQRTREATLKAFGEDLEVDVSQHLAPDLLKIWRMDVAGGDKTRMPKFVGAMAQFRSKRLTFRKKAKQQKDSAGQLGGSSSAHIHLDDALFKLQVLDESDALSLKIKASIAASARYLAEVEKRIELEDSKCPLCGSKSADLQKMKGRLTKSIERQRERLVEHKKGIVRVDVEKQINRARAAMKSEETSDQLKLAAREAEAMASRYDALAAFCAKTLDGFADIAITRAEKAVNAFLPHPFAAKLDPSEFRWCMVGLDGVARRLRMSGAEKVMLRIACAVAYSSSDIKFLFLDDDEMKGFSDETLDTFLGMLCRKVASGAVTQVFAAMPPRDLSQDFAFQIHKLSAPHVA